MATLSLLQMAWLWSRTLETYAMTLILEIIIDSTLFFPLLCAPLLPYELPSHMAQVTELLHHSPLLLPSPPYARPHSKLGASHVTQ